MFGTKEFYKWRAEDFKRRNPGKEPPAYYMDYGDKYARIFSDEVRGKLSDKGKKWVDDTRRILQEDMEQRIASGEMNELDPEAFENMAFDMHSDAYQQGGIDDLPFEDTSKILDASWKDLGTLNALGEALEGGCRTSEPKPTKPAGTSLKQWIGFAKKALVVEQSACQAFRAWQALF